jgi:hypothetical protein
MYDVYLPALDLSVEVERIEDVEVIADWYARLFNLECSAFKNKAA